MSGETVHPDSAGGAGGDHTLPASGLEPGVEVPEGPPEQCVKHTEPTFPGLRTAAVVLTLGEVAGGSESPPVESDAWVVWAKLRGVRPATWSWGQISSVRRAKPGV